MIRLNFDSKSIGLLKFANNLLQKVIFLQRVQKIILMTQNFLRLIDKFKIF